LFSPTKSHTEVVNLFNLNQKQEKEITKNCRTPSTYFLDPTHPERAELQAEASVMGMFRIEEKGHTNTDTCQYSRYSAVEWDISLVMPARPFEWALLTTPSMLISACSNIL
jgi:hypothetical protein